MTSQTLNDWLTVMRNAQRGKLQEYDVIQPVSDVILSPIGSLAAHAS